MRLECNEQELVALGYALLHAMNHHGHAIEVVMVDRDNKDLQHTFQVMALRVERKEGASHERH
jgi:hypothetical protein